MENDPFEGLLPEVILKQWKDIFQSSLGPSTKQTEEALKIVERDDKSNELVAEANEKLERIKVAPKNIFKHIIERIGVSCWHKGSVESESMWKIYSDAGKGIAIKSTVKRLKDSLGVQDLDTKIRINKVRYLDFFDKDLDPQECIIDGKIIAFIKRKSYATENEVRAYTFPDLGHQPNDDTEPEGISVLVDVNTLVENIYISPFAGPPFPSSIVSVCKKFGFDSDKVIPSSLLSSGDRLLDILRLE